LDLLFMWPPVNRYRKASPPKNIIRLGLILIILSWTLFRGATPLLAQTAPNEQHAVIAPLAVKSLLLDVAQRDGLIVAVGERGHILWSDDRGQTWTQARVPTRATLTGVTLHDRKLGWAVGHDGVILRTLDGGQNWDLLRNAPKDDLPLLDIWFLDDQEGYAIGAYGLLLHTHDGGATWQQEAVHPQDDFHLNHFVVTQDGRYYLAAEAGSIYRSLDAATRWERVMSPYTGSFFGILPLKNNVLLLFGLRGHLFRSGDGGLTWHVLETKTKALLLAGQVMIDGTVIIVGMDGVVLISHDDGENFRLHPQADRKGITGVLDAGAGNLVLVGETGVRRVSLLEVESGQ
jgi:photosystem II stability/assembly factor-like uncharacterized protein